MRTVSREKSLFIRHQIDGGGRSEAQKSDGSPYFPGFQIARGDFSTQTRWLFAAVTVLHVGMWIKLLVMQGSVYVQTTEG